MQLFGNAELARFRGIAQGGVPGECSRGVFQGIVPGGCDFSRIALLKIEHDRGVQVAMLN
jgi:hypothetical protein